MSPGNQILALTAKKATPNRSTIITGSILVLIKLTKFFLVCLILAFFIEELKKITNNN